MIAEGRVEPGIVRVHSATIITSDGTKIDVKNIMAELNLYESVMAPFITGDMILGDAMSLSELAPLIGEETLILDIETPGFDLPMMRRTSAYHIYKMEERLNASLKNVMYKLCFVSMEAFTDMNLAISQTFRGRISETVKKILKAPTSLNTIKGVLVEDTTNNEIHTSNFWTPSQNIFYLATKATNNLGNPSFVFFENNEGFVFASLDRLYGIEPNNYFVRDSKTRDPGESVDIDEEYKRILDMSTDTFFDYIERLEQGMYGGSIYAFDIQTKRMNYKIRMAEKDFEKTRMNETLAMTKDIQFRPDAILRTQVTHKGLYEGSPTLPIDHPLKRMSLLKQLEAFKVNIQVFGRMDYSVGRTADLLVYVDKNIDKADSDDQLIDEMLSGKYLITAVNHKITRDSHVCNMELSRDSMPRKAESSPK